MKLAANNPDRPARTPLTHSAPVATRGRLDQYENMFQSALIRRHASGEKLVDAGTIAETLLFYRNVHLVANGPILSEIIRLIGADDLVRLLRDKYLTMSYHRSTPVVFTNTENYVERHSFATVRIEAHADKTRVTNAREVTEAVERVLGKSRHSKKVSQALLDKIEFINVGPQSQDEVEVVTRECLPGPLQTTKTVRELLRVMVPGYKLPPDFFFRTELSDDSKQFFVFTNLDYAAINSEYHVRVPFEHSSITDGYILCHVLDANIDIGLSAGYMAELVGTEETSAILQIKFRHLLERRGLSLKEISLFQDVHLNSANAIREVINSGERTFTEFLQILAKAEKFKQWLAGANPDSRLLREYHEAVTRDTWVGGLPAKSLRWTVASGIGLAGLLPGLVAAAADEFLVDRLLRGWRPNQFVEGQLRRFTSSG